MIVPRSLTISKNSNFQINFFDFQNENLFFLQIFSAASTDEDRQQMTEVGQIHVGDMINVFRHGSLVMENLGDSSTQHSGSILYGTVQGAIGM